MREMCSRLFVVHDYSLSRQRNKAPKRAFHKLMYGHLFESTSA